MNLKLALLEKKQKLKNQKIKMDRLLKNIDFNKKQNIEYEELLSDIKSQIQEKERDKTSKKRASNERLSQAKMIYNDQIRNMEFFLSSLCCMGGLCIESYDKLLQYDMNSFQLDITYYSPHNNKVYMGFRLRFINLELFNQIKSSQGDLEDELFEIAESPIIEDKDSNQAIENMKELKYIGIKFAEIQNDIDVNFLANIFEEITDLDKIITQSQPLYITPINQGSDEIIF